ALEVAALRSVANMKLELTDFYQPPLRSPHHTATPASLVGGGARALPGEVSLAHHGVLFLDELPEFAGKALEVLREPLEARHITIARAKHRIRYPASFQLVAAMNPCPCGYLGDPSGRCRCTQPRIDTYRQKLSGPLLDRFDLLVEVPRLSHGELVQREDAAERSATVREKVSRCRQLQLERAGVLNSSLGTSDLDRYCKLDKTGNQLLQQAMKKLHLSARGFHRVLRLARTLADYNQRRDIEEAHLLEALTYRP
ncbi:MAG: ATP-binding protein, partial [Gammaproteobacteria bacterium]|nr:ATP-binding protein [Gammaproteobacteria bacterium]